MFDSELKVMELLWEHQPVSAKQLSLLAGDTIGWNKNTTYTIIKKLVNKKIIRREEPGFICTPLVNKEQVQQAETDDLIRRLYNGSKKAFFASFIEKGNLSAEEFEQLKQLIEKR